MPISRFAPAKLNLYLHVIGRRANGYHELDSLVVFVDVGDVVHVEPSASLRLTVRGTAAAALAGEDDNLVLRAARALASAAGRDAAAEIRLDKELPVAAGLGGGSSDAAAALQALAQLWNCELEDEALAAIALGLGADVPACLKACPLRMQGIGEELRDVPELPRFAVLLVNPRVPLATRDVFAARGSGFSEPASLPVAFRDLEHLLDVLAAARNDLEAPACALEPSIAPVLADLAGLPGARLARMSGSGATCFAVFADRSAADHAAGLLQARHPGWWIRSAEPIGQPPRG